jgi:hypothetical protein
MLAETPLQKHRNAFRRALRAHDAGAADRPLGWIRSGAGRDSEESDSEAQLDDARDTCD